MANDGAECMFLGEPAWETLGGGRVRCVQTGHEMPEAAKTAYVGTKKCRSALFDAALARRLAPLNFFEQSPVSKDKIICKLTGVVLNKKEDAVWKHMMGKKFEQKLVEKEAEKEKSREDVSMTETSSEKQSPRMAVGNLGKKQAKRLDEVKGKKAERTAVSLEEVEGIEGDVNSEDSDFWVPPVGDRWDFDDGNNDRWSIPSEEDSKVEQEVSVRMEEADAPVIDHRCEVDGDIQMSDGEGDDCVENSSSDVEEDKIRTKRTAAGSSVRKVKRRAKRLKTLGRK